MHSDTNCRIDCRQIGPKTAQRREERRRASGDRSVSNFLLPLVMLEWCVHVRAGEGREGISDPGSGVMLISTDVLRYTVGDGCGLVHVPPPPPPPPPTSPQYVFHTHTHTPTHTPHSIPILVTSVPGSVVSRPRYRYRPKKPLVQGDLSASGDEMARINCPTVL